MRQDFSLLTKERVASIREIQKNPSRALRGITRVMRGSNTIGFFLSNEEMDDLMEDFEALNSTELKRRVTAARRGLKKGEYVTVEKLAQEYGV